MSTEQAPLTNKLILLVLTLILACLVVLVAQHYVTRDTPPLAPGVVESAATETATAPRPEPVQYAPLRPRLNTAPVPARSTNAAPKPALTAAAATFANNTGRAPNDRPLQRGAHSTEFDPAIALHPGDNAASRASLFGLVTLTGDPPRETVVQVTDKMCGAGAQPRTISTRHYVVNNYGGLANVLVWIKEGVAKTPPTSDASTLLDQVLCEFAPYVMAVQTGQKFKIRNSDPGLHNIHATPRSGSGNKEFNFGQPLKGMISERSFDFPEVFVRLKCDVHPWMFAHVGVVDHPFFSVTDTNGVFRLPPGLPAGRYTLAATHLKAGEVVQEIDITAGDNKALSLTLQVPPTR